MLGQEFGFNPAKVSVPIVHRQEHGRMKMAFQNVNPAGALLIMPSPQIDQNSCLDRLKDFKDWICKPRVKQEDLGGKC